MKLKTLIGLLLILCIVLAGCSTSKFDIVGMWKDQDGTTRIFSSDGTCQNIAKIDIGGPAPIYTLSEKANNNGYYLTRR